MYLNFKVEVPASEGGNSRKTIKGTAYIYYEHGRKYYSDKGYTVPQCTSIGKLCEDEPGMMIPNGNYLKFFPDVELPDELPVSVRSGCLKVGTYLVIKKVIEHYKLDEEIKRIIGKDAGLFLNRGYFSEPNIRFMDKNGYDFIIMVKGCKDIVNRLILENRGTF